MPLHRSFRRSHDQSSIGWISNTDAVMFGMVVFLVVAVYFERKAAYLEGKNDPECPRKLGEVKSQLKAALNDLEAAQSSVANWRREAETSARRIESMVVETAAMQKVISEMRSDNDRLSGENANLAKSVKSLAGRLKTGAEVNEGLRREFRKLREELDAETKSHKEDLAKLASLGESADDLRRQVANLQQENGVMLADLRRTKLDETRIRMELIGLKGRRGKLGRVVIVFDASFSMKEGGRWDKARSVMQDWLKYLDIDAGALVVFGTDVTVFPPNGALLELRGGTTGRDQLRRFLEGVEPVGGTNTLAALERAYAYPDCDAILLFTDGAPNDGQGAAFDPQVAERIYALCNSHRDIPINTVGLGDYFKPELSQFLLKVAEITGGTFLGR
jgi:hypothetical protein